MTNTTHPYRTFEIPVKQPGKRWGATRWVKFYVQYVMSRTHRKIEHIRRHAPKFSLCVRCGATYRGHGRCLRCAGLPNPMYKTTIEELL